jgi:hypothetical protein
VKKRRRDLRPSHPELPATPPADVFAAPKAGGSQDKPRTCSRALPASPDVTTGTPADTHRAFLRGTTLPARQIAQVPGSAKTIIVVPVVRIVPVTVRQATVVVIVVPRTAAQHTPIGLPSGAKNVIFCHAARHLSTFRFLSCFFVILSGAVRSTRATACDALVERTVPYRMTNVAYT